jgi:protein TonB
MPDLFGMADLDQSLIPLVRMAPVYPLTAKRKGTEGWVTVSFIVNEHGTVENITISEAQPPGIFDDSVSRCVSGWRFQPGTVQGRPVKVWAETTIHFELD